MASMNVASTNAAAAAFARRARTPLRNEKPMTATDDPVLRVEHDTTVDAPAALLRRLITDVSWWPLLFAPTLHAEVLQRTDAGDRLGMWGLDVQAARAVATGGDPGPAAAVRAWTSRRSFHTAPSAPTDSAPGNTTPSSTASGPVSFSQEEPQPPLASMGGTWRFEERGGGSRVVLSHEASVREGAIGAHPWIEPMVERITLSQLASLKAAAELPDGPVRSLITVAETVRVRGPLARPPGLAAAVPARAGTEALVLAEPGRWPGTDDPRDVSVWIPLPRGRWVFKHLRPPGPISALTGEWTIRAAPEHGSDELLVTLRRRALLAGPGHRAEAEALLARDVREQLRHLVAAARADGVRAA